MIRDSAPSSARPERLSTLDVPIRVRRDRQAIEIDDVELHIDARARFGADPEIRESQIRWVLDGDLLPDEIVLIFGCSLDWSGPARSRQPRLPLVEDVFSHPFALCRTRPWMLSGPPRVPFPRGVDVVGWKFGVVLVRGEDTPWTGGSVLRLVRAAP